MQYNYPDNSNTLIVNYHRVREGPNWIMVYYKNIATPCLTVKDVRARFGSAKFTETCKKVCAWVQECIDKYDASALELDMDKVSKEGFGPEAYLDETDPNYQTKMVT